MQLAEANPEDICFCHQEGMVIKEKHPVTLCTSFNPHGEVEQGLVVPQPGKGAYNKLAFTKFIVGTLDEDGAFYEIDL
jgi:hypothetical protein